MSSIFDEKNMMQVLQKCLPDGETIKAAIHACADESHIKRVFSGCIFDDFVLIPAENGGIIEVSKSKYSAYDIYIGITTHYLLIDGCEKYKYYYEFKYDVDINGVDVEEVKVKTSLLEDIKMCYPFEAIQNCEIKNGWMGSVKCNLTMKNGDYFKLMFPKRGGLGGGMPNHKQYRDEIISCLSARNE